MRGYERDEYEELDEYEEDGEEHEYEDGHEDEYEEEQVRQPTQEEVEYLQLRQRLKESIRKQMKKELGTANGGSRNKMNGSREDNYGSFFGPSQPVIAQRVIQESKSLLENPNLAARISKPNSTNNKNPVSSNSSGSKTRVNPPKSINGLNKKVELLKNTRDYSFLLSDDADIPGPTKTSPRNVSTPKSDARSAQPPPKSKHVANNRGRDISNNRDGKKQIVANGQTRPKAGSSSSSKLPMEYRKHLGSNNASGPGRPIGPKGGPSKSPVSATGKKVMQSGGKTNPVAGARKPMPSVQQPQVRKPAPPHLQSGVNRPMQSGAHRAASSHMQSSLSRNTSLQRKVYPEESSMPKVAPRSSLPSSRNEVKRPPAKIVSRGAVAEQRPKPKPGKRPFESDDEEDPINIIRNLFKRNPNEFQDDDDDSDMEAGFDDIMEEELRSERIARKEDEEQARLLEEEERRRKMRLAKKRKMGH